MSEPKKILSLLKKDIKHKIPRSHVKSKPISLHKYKAKIIENLVRPGEPLKETQYFCAIDLDSMPKALLAYHKVSAKKNSVKPDNVASIHKASPPQEKPEEPPSIPLSVSPAKLPEYADEERRGCPTPLASDNCRSMRSRRSCSAVSTLE